MLMSCLVYWAFLNHASLAHRRHSWLNLDVLKRSHRSTNWKRYVDMLAIVSHWQLLPVLNFDWFYYFRYWICVQVRYESMINFVRVSLSAASICISLWRTRLVRYDIVHIYDCIAFLSNVWCRFLRVVAKANDASPTERGCGKNAGVERGDDNRSRVDKYSEEILPRYSGAKFFFPGEGRNLYQPAESDEHDDGASQMLQPSVPYKWYLILTVRLSCVCVLKTKFSCFMVWVCGTQLLAQTLGLTSEIKTIYEPETS